MENKFDVEELFREKIEVFIDMLADEDFCNCRCKDDGTSDWTCHNDFRFSRDLLDCIGATEEQIEEVISTFKERGAWCDCEVIFNLTDDINLKMFARMSEKGIAVCRDCHNQEH